MIQAVIISVLLLACTGFALPRHSWEFYYEKGLIQYRAGMYTDSMLNMELCLDANPRCYKAANILAGIYLKKQMKLKAKDYYETSLHIKDDQADIHYELGVLYEFFIQRDLAFKHFSRAVRIDPRNIRAICSLARSFLQRHDARSAEAYFKSGRDLAIKESGKILLEADEAREKGTFGQALLLYGDVISVCPCMAEPYMGMYEIHMARNDFRAAADALERLKSARPDSEKAYVLLADLYFTRRLPGKRKKHLDRAIEYLHKALLLNPRNSDTCYALAAVYRYIGRDVEARAWEEKGRELESNAGKGK
jgi:tetratricopeptide (TPR) repeat protein